MVGDRLPGTILCQQLISNLSAPLAEALKLPEGHRAVGILTCDSDDLLYLAVDEATKAANVAVAYARSLYAGAANATTALAGEAICVLSGRTPAEVSQLAVKGALMGFFGPERPEEPSRIAVCTVLEEGREQRFYTMDFGRFSPQHALKRAITYGRETGIPATQAMACLTLDHPEFAAKPGGPRCILHGWESELTEALFQIQPDCPAVAAARATHRKITLLRVCHASRSIKAVFCHRLYRGLDVVSIRISLHGYPTTKKSPAVCRGMNGAPGGTKRAHSAGSSISVVKAPSSEFRLMYPPRRSTMASMRTSPRPWPAPLVLRKSFPTLGSFFPAVKLVMEI